MVLGWRRRRSRPGVMGPLPAAAAGRPADGPSAGVPPVAAPYVFVSYAREDSDYVARLAGELEAAGISVWYDRELASGDRWELVLRQRVDNCSALVVVMSPAAAASPWVRLEVGRARWREDALSRVRPVLLAGDALPYVADLQYETVPAGQIVPSTRFLDGLRRLVATPRPQRAPGAGRVVGPWPGRHPHFVGRADLLATLEADLYTGSAVAVTALNGLGGVGKTQLAAEYVHRRRGDYDLVAWIAAQRPESIAVQLADLAPEFGVPADDDVPATARAVVAALGRTSRAWLLVFDNAEQPDDLAGWLPRHGTGHVIVTSRHRGWSDFGSTVDVDVMRRDESVALLRRSVRSIDEQVAAGIAEQLGDLPLAVEQAAGYLATEGMAPADYLRLLRTRSEELLHRGHAPAGHEHTIATVFTISQESLAAASPAGEHLLRLCAFLGPEPIPLDLFTTHPDLLPPPLSDAARDELTFHDTVGALVARSLATPGPDGTTLTVHRLLAAAVRRSLPSPDRDQTASTVRAVLQRHLPGQIQYAPHNWPRWRGLLPHVLITTRNPTRDTTDRYRTAGLLDTAAVYLVQTGRRTEALAVSEQAVTLYRELAAHNRDAYLPALAASVHNHALRLADNGRRAEALAAAEEAVTLYRELAAHNRDAYLPALAMSLWMFGFVRQMLDTQEQEGFDAVQEAVSLFTELAAAEPEAFEGRLRAVAELLRQLRSREST